jgi:hypothetical protein
MKEKVLRVRRPEPSAQRPYDDELVAAVNQRQTKAGIAWKAYHGTFPWIPQWLCLQRWKPEKRSAPKPKFSKSVITV